MEGARSQGLRLRGAVLRQRMRIPTLRLPCLSSSSVGLVDSKHQGHARTVHQVLYHMQRLRSAQAQAQARVCIIRGGVLPTCSATPRKETGQEGGSGGSYPVSRPGVSIALPLRILLPYRMRKDTGGYRRRLRAAARCTPVTTQSTALPSQHSPLGA